MTVIEKYTGEMLPVKGLLISLANYMYYLGEHFSRSMLRWELSCIDRLYGFPCLPEWQERPISTEARVMALGSKIDIKVAYQNTLPESSRDSYERACDRITRKYKMLSSSCSVVWMPIYNRLIDTDCDMGNDYP